MQRSILSISIFAGLLAGCGGGSTESVSPTVPPASNPPTESPATTVKSGVITGFGSVYIDGKRYTTDGTTITVNGSSGVSIESLKVGMRIQLTSDDDETNDEASATSITYDSDVEGIIQAIDRVENQIQIAGVTIVYDDLTHFIDTSVSGLAVGQRIEVSGYALADGSFYATYIEPETTPSGSDTESITGIVSELDTNLQQFKIGTTLVDYRAAVVEGNLAAGQQVKVEGLFSDGIFAASELEVRSVRYDNEDTVAEVEVEGVITAVDSTAATFEVYGETYTYTAATRFENGTADDLVAGVMVELYIEFANGEQSVAKVEFKQQTRTDGKVKGRISAIDVDSGSITVNNTPFYVNAQTRYEDDDDQYVALSYLQVNDLIELVYQTVNEQNIVLRLERENDDQYYEESEIKGYLSAFTASTLTLAGLTIGMPADAIYLMDDRSVTQAAFAAALAIGIKVEIRGNYDADGVFVANKFELEWEQNDDSDDESDNDGEENGENEDAGDNDHFAGSYLEIEGRVMAIVGETRFTLNGYEVDISTARELELDDRDVSVAEFMAALSVDTIVEVEGTLDSNGVLVAREAEIDREDD